MKQYRLNRLFNPDSNRCFSVALDQGILNERSTITGLENIERSIHVAALAGPDAVQLAPGQAPLLQGIPGRNKPALLLRADVTNVYSAGGLTTAYSKLIDRPVEQALRLDAAAIVVSLISLPEHQEVNKESLANVLALKPECERHGLPLMVEPLIFQTNPRGGYAPSGDADRLLTLVRQAVELGADFVAADPTDDIGAYRKVLEAARVPVLVRAGGRVADREILERAEQVIALGAAGIAYNSSLIQHPDPAGLTRALMAIVHERARALDAGRFIRT